MSQSLLSKQMFRHPDFTLITNQIIMYNGTRNQTLSTLFTYPDGIRSMGLHISKLAMEWLSQTVIDNYGNKIRYLSLFNDLLRQFCFRWCDEREFYRQIEVNAGQAQISENLLVDQWHMGRKRIHRILLDMESLGLISLASDRTATVVTFTCVYDWVTDSGYRYENAFYRYRSLSSINDNSDHQH